jgi:hypothetical protein
MWKYCVHLTASLGLLGILIGGLTIGLYPRLYDFIMKKVLLHTVTSSFIVNSDAEPVNVIADQTPGKFCAAPDLDAPQH